MKVVIIAAGSSIHTVRWVNGLIDEGVDVHLISQHPVQESISRKATIHRFPFRGSIGYFSMVPGVKKVLSRVNPDVVNAHYASGYGTTARLAGFQPWVLSIWGSDVYSFPYRSFLHKSLVIGNILGSNCVTSTSNCMAEQARSLSRKIGHIDVVPFGINVSDFTKPTLSTENKPTIVVGTVKSMLPVYGIDVLIRSFAKAVNRLTLNNPKLSNKIKLRIVGGGEYLEQYKTLCLDLGIAHITEFTGVVPHEQVPLELSKMEVFAALSHRESFGVAVLEASASGLPVIVSAADGLKEVTVDGHTGLVVPIDDIEASARAISKLVTSDKLRREFGANGRKLVLDQYSWKTCTKKMLEVFLKCTTSA